MKHNGETQRASLLSASLQDLPDQPEALTRARAFAQPLLMGATLDTGEDALSHADAVTVILDQIGAPKPCKPRVIWSMPLSICKSPKR